jgi:glyoxylase-like metal-dependent hydrolase (beta-lactamase superfamily II)
VTKPFASTQDLEAKPAQFDELGPGVFAYITGGDPNCGVIVGADGVMVIDARATPALARELIAEIRRVTDRPIRWLALTHYHAVRTLGASAFNAPQIIAHRNMRVLVAERGQQDFESERGRFPRLFRAVEEVPGLTVPNVVFDRELTLELGGREVRLLWLGRGHTEGDAVVFLPGERVLFAGDLVEAGAAPYCGDAFFQDWLVTLERVRELRAEVLVPGRGPAVRGAAVEQAINDTKEYLSVLFDTVAGCVKEESTLKQAYEAAHAALAPRFGKWTIFEHCLPFNVSRAYDEVAGLRPRIWTATRDRALWDALTA